MMINFLIGAACMLAIVTAALTAFVTINFLIGAACMLAIVMAALTALVMMKTKITEMVKKGLALFGTTKE